MFWISIIAFEGVGAETSYYIAVGLIKALLVGRIIKIGQLNGVQGSGPIFLVGVPIKEINWSTGFWLQTSKPLVSRPNEKIRQAGSDLPVCNQKPVSRPISLIVGRLEKIDPELKDHLVDRFNHSIYRLVAWINFLCFRLIPFSKDWHFRFLFLNG